MKQIFLGFLTPSILFAMNFEATNVVVWRSTESIRGESFVAATESVRDYIATLPRPTAALVGIKYRCMAKTHAIGLSVGSISSTSSPGSVTVRSVYDLKDCVERGE